MEVFYLQGFLSNQTFKFMKNFKYLTSLLLIFLAFSINANAQFKYKEEYKTIDGVEVSYKWAPSKWWKKGSPQQLRFKMKNTNEQDVSIKFELVYMLDHVVKFKSGELEATIKAGRAISGKLNGFYFESPEISNKDLNSDRFEWEFLHYDVILQQNLE